jgi:heme exporter protein C
MIVPLKVFQISVVIWLSAIVILGLTITIPDIEILRQSARNLFFHVPMWFTMFINFLISFVYSIKYLNNPNPEFDFKAVAATSTGILFGIAGLLTGSLWARFTWGAWWTFAEPRMNLSAVALLILAAYFVLRSAFDNPEKRAKMAAVYNIFAVSTVPFLFYIIPRQLPSLHPGAEGNPAFSEVTSPELRLIFYPAVIGFIALSMWIFNLSFRYLRIQHHLTEIES